MNITHSLNGHPNTGRQAEIILEREKKKPRKKNRIIDNNINENIRTLILCFGSINNPCPNFIFIVTKREVIKNGYFTVKLIGSGGSATSALTVIKCKNFNLFFH